MQELLGYPADPLWVLVPGASEEALAQRLAAVETVLAKARSRRWCR